MIAANEMLIQKIKFSKHILHILHGLRGKNVIDLVEPSLTAVV